MKLFLANRFFYPDDSPTSLLLTDLAFHLADRGYEVHVIASRQRYFDPSHRLPAEECIRGVRIHRTWSSRFSRRYLLGQCADYLSFCFSFYRYLRRNVGPNDLVVAKSDPPLLSVVAYWIARRRGAKLINWVQDVFPEIAVATRVLPENRWLTGFFRGLRNRALSYASSNVVVSHGMAASLARELDPGQILTASQITPTADLGSTNSRRLVVIPDWADGKQLCSMKSERNRLREEWGLAEYFVAGYLGNMGRAHEFETILRGAEMLMDRANIRILFVGDGAQRDWVEREISKRGLTNVLMKTHQPQERLCETLNVADIHLVTLSPAVDGLCFPSKVYSAMAVGRPILFVGNPSSEVGGMIVEEQCGFAIAVGDAATLAEHIRNLASDYGRLSLMGVRARVLFEERFDRTRGLRAWSEVIESVVGE